MASAPDLIAAPESGGDILSLRTCGPVATAFTNDKSLITCLMGPYGSGKTTAAYRKILNTALWQNPGPDGVRRSRGVVVRAVYSHLKKNVLPSWFSWFPKTEKNWSEQDMKHTLKFKTNNVGMGSHVEIETHFIACDDMKAIEKLLKGLEITWAFLNEVDTLHPSIMRFLLPRLGRYPDARMGGCNWYGVFADMNAPDMDNHAYKMFFEGDRSTLAGMDDEPAAEAGGGDIKIHVQPSGFSDEAENIHNLPPGYYRKMALGMTAGDIRRFIENKPGFTKSGQPVYPEFNPDFHIAKKENIAVAGAPALLAFDGGSTPAAVLLQYVESSRQIRVLDEIVIFTSGDEDMLMKMGPVQFARDCRAHLHRHWPKLILDDRCVCDPACFYGDDTEGESFARRFATEFQRLIVGGGEPGNRIGPRLEAVRSLLMHNPSGGEPGLLVSPKCKYLRQGFTSGYVLERVVSGSSNGRLRDIPKKGNYSHVHDALQYGVLHLTRRGSGYARGDRRFADRAADRPPRFTGMARFAQRPQLTSRRRII